MEVERLWFKALELADVCAASVEFLKRNVQAATLLKVSPVGCQTLA
jgi:hypothetical protein